MAHIAKGDFSTTIRANIRVLFSFGEQSSWIIDTGISERPWSGTCCINIANFGDQFEVFSRKETIPLWDDETLVEKEISSEL
jgi:hypothetical protein